MVHRHLSAERKSSRERLSGKLRDGKWVCIAFFSTSFYVWASKTPPRAPARSAVRASCQGTPCRALGVESIVGQESGAKLAVPWTPGIGCGKPRVMGYCVHYELIRGCAPETNLTQTQDVEKIQMPAYLNLQVVRKNVDDKVFGDARRVRCNGRLFE